MKPFLRRCDQAPIAPVGWTAEPAGTWAGHEVEVVYDPRRHDLVRLHFAGDRERAVLGTAGYRRVAEDEHQELWARDRVAVARQRLDRSPARIDRDVGLSVGT